MAQRCPLFPSDCQVEENDFPLPETTNLQTNDTNEDLDPYLELEEDYYGAIVVRLIELGFLPDRRHKGCLPSVVERRKGAPGVQVKTCPHCQK